MLQGRQKLLDYCLLILTGLACAALSWLLWRFVGGKGITILNIIFLVVTFLDNVRLRMRIEQLEQQLKQNKGN